MKLQKVTKVLENNKSNNINDSHITFAFLNIKNYTFDNLDRKSILCKFQTHSYIFSTFLDIKSSNLNNLNIEFGLYKSQTCQQSKLLLSFAYTI